MPVHVRCLVEASAVASSLVHSACHGTGARMSVDLLPQLQATLGEVYTIERELGGGGMSRVFVAEELALGRRVVVKVLAPELAEGLSAERFAREARLAARTRGQRPACLRCGSALGYHVWPGGHPVRNLPARTG